MSEEGAPAPELARGILVTHGNMAAGMLDATRKIAGAPADALVAVSNDSVGPEDLVRAVSDLAGDAPTVIFTDLQTGSCALAARFVCRNPLGRRVVFGVNLPMLLDFVFHRHLPLDELVDRLIERGRSAIRSQTSEVGERGDRPVSR
jgi:mannose/fructose-specific phosphotransferase system component IIA